MLTRCFFLFAFVVLLASNGKAQEIDITVQPGNYIRLNEGDALDISCVAEGPVDDLNVVFEHKGEVVGENDANRASLIIPSVTVGDAGVYTCKATSEQGYANEDIEVEIEPAVVITRPPIILPPVVPDGCKIDEATCRNGQCIPIYKRCDGKIDCADGSDELCGDRYDKVCEPNERACGNGHCAPKFWFCDGENDCKDQSDEQNCAAKKPGDLCQSFEYLCKNRNQCVFKGFVCDGQIDCADSSDEIGCEAPRITKNPVRTLNVCVGETIVIECEAAGFPAPYINWRLNWGHICNETRCSYTTVNGYGILTIKDARVYDAGAYYCEAMSTKGRQFAIDTIVTVRTGCNAPPPPPPPPKPAPCFCNRHSDRCEFDGTCINCQHNTYGRNCELCLPGWIGDARGGTPYDCTRQTTPPRPLRRCNPNGVIPGTPTVAERCTCRCEFAGETCSDVNNFAITIFDGERSYCQECFCNKLEDATCRPSSWYYRRQYFKISSYQPNYLYGWTVRNRYLNMTADERSLSVKQEGDDYAIIFDTRPTSVNQEWFYLVPDEFKGNRLNSYDGNITFQIAYFVPEELEQTVDEDDIAYLEIRLQGREIALRYTHQELIYPNNEDGYFDVKVRLLEKNFRRYPDNSPVSYDHMKMALSQIDNIMITASFHKSQTQVKLRNFYIDVAKPCRDPTRKVQLVATNIEKCVCPVGYEGTSCELCAAGYRRSKEGSYLGLCIPCNCYGHSTQCDINGECLNCQHNTEGRSCEFCKPGFVGDAKLGEFGCRDIRKKSRFWKKKRVFKKKF